MTVFIADDEQSIRQGLKKLIDWQALGFYIAGEAADGNEALSKIRAIKPDLVLIDMKMPGLSGIEVMEELVCEGFDGRFLILSAYSDFEYARRALELRCNAYLLKPVDEDELIERVRHIRHELSQAGEERSLKRRQKLEHIIHMGSEENKTEEGIFFQTVFFDFSRLTMSHEEFEALLKTSFPCLSPDILMLGGGLLLVFQNEAEADIRRHLLRLAQRLKNPCAVLGPRLRGANGLKESTLQAQRQAGELFFLADGLFGESGAEAIPPQIEEITDCAGKIIFYMETYDRDALSSLMEQKAHSLSLRTEDEVKQEAIALLLELQTRLTGAYPEREFTNLKASDLLPRILEMRRFYEVVQAVRDWVFQSLEQFWDNHSDARIIKVIRYVESHFSEELRLEDLGKRFNCNSAYLGKKFREGTGIPFNTYLDRLRIEEAQKKLVDTNLKIYQISKLVGYANTDYFFIKFHKYTGITPREYRNLHKNS